MTKQEIWNEVRTKVEETLREAKVANEVEERVVGILRNYISPKRGVVVNNPPKEIDGVMHYYCKFHEKYEPESDIVFSSGESKGYCRASLAKWNRTNSKIKQLEKKATNLMLEGEMEEAVKCAKEAKELRDVVNSPEFYDYKEDWKIYKANNS